MSTTLPTYDDVQAAAARLKGVAHRTPVMRSATADALLGAELFFKCENLQRMGAFKFRGGYNTLAQFTPEQKKRGVLAFSSGNHAQAIALSARILGMPAAIVMPEDAPAAKLAATRGYGAEVITYDRFTEDREAISQRIAGERGMTLVPPFNHPHVIAGQGTAAMELLEEVPGLDYLFAPLGGGGLLSGTLLAAKALAPQCRVYGVEPEAGNDAQQSLRKGEIVKIATPKTIADGAQTQALGDITFAIIRRDVSDILTASDAQLGEAMRFYAERMKIVVEPTGALSFAGARHSGLDLKGKRVGFIISGGNVDLASYGQLLAG
ncbi:threo-3-hydroxy-L-aspartate ammonia-lyase [Diaphorobacter ruginosibacter]|uniref:Threo-3-hydroxy-L-aspartate ammonia-lyase n=1 Tax=Diaphorobacter ruginosibacter TaxID=1715720 RepID=A0A7G9RU93_9BURK|nr:threo-3-hydroxy-L-aspartate ammonia-lyase [Diaphorobacter ruginosibacter]QNN59168.1 threo-3-hydroxy-L-aspartate ammonia-lyase [Diaphorobacter ruginosibacter]